MNKVDQELQKYDDTIIVTLHNTSDLFRMIYIKLVPFIDKAKKLKSSISINLPFVSVNFTSANDTHHNEVYYKILNAFGKLGVKKPF